jgi:futalosine hydrolase
VEICLVAATPGECQLIEERLSGEPLPAASSQRLRASGKIGNHWVDLLVTGVGAVNTTWALSRGLSRFPYKLIVNVGVCGAIDRRLPLGSVVSIVQEIFGELGAEDQDGSFLDLHSIGLPLHQTRSGTWFNRLAAPDLPYPEPNLPRVVGVTADRAHGEQQSIDRLTRHWPDAQVESMEGAAFFYAALRSHVPFVAIRGISNYVEPRDRSSWRLPEAAAAAQQAALSWIESLG